MNLNEYLPPRVAVVELSGLIGLRLNAREYTKLLASVGENPRIKAVVLDIDSPGGLAHASEDIYLAARRLGESRPLAAAIRGVGASGAYMVACAAERIFAIPSAMVGSIGVISARPMVEELLEKAGVRMTVSKSVRFKDMGSFFRPPTEEECAKEQSIVDAIHARFTEIVREGRPGLAAEQIDDLATGEIYLGTTAREKGLVDELGTLGEAVQWAAGRAGIDAKTMVMRPRRGLMQLMLQRGASGFIDEITASVVERLYMRSLGIPGY